MNLNKELIYKVKNETSIVDIIKQFIKLNKNGNNYKGVCPFHNDTSPSLIVNDQKKIYKCFSCNNSGDVFTFVKNFKNISYSNAVLEVADLSNIDSNTRKKILLYSKDEEINSPLYEINNQSMIWFNNFLHNDENKKYMDYLNNRGIDLQLIEKFKIGYAPSDQSIMIDLLRNKENILSNNNQGFSYDQISKAGMSYLSSKGDYISFFNDRIIFPIMDENNNIVGFSGRTINRNENTKYINTATTKIFNKNEILFNMNNIMAMNDIDSLYIVEGFMDVISLHGIGIKNAVATMGVAFTKNHLNLLFNLPNLKNIFLAFDNDEAGQESIPKIANIMPQKYNLYVVRYDSELKDIDEIIQKDKTKALEVIDNLEDITTYLIKKLWYQKENKTDYDKKAFLIESIKLLSLCEDIIFKNNNIDFICTKTGYQKEIINEYINKNKVETKIENIYEKKVAVSNKEIFSCNADIEILKCVLFNRQCLEIFENKLNYLLNEENFLLLQKIQDFYYKNPLVDSIKIENIKNIFEDEDIISKTTAWIIQNENKILKNVLDALNKTIKSIFNLENKRFNFNKKNNFIKIDGLEKRKEYIKKNYEDQTKIKIKRNMIK